MKFSSPFGEAKIVSIVISCLIVTQSLAARQVFIFLTRWITFTSNSERLRMIVLAVFAIFFANYGLLYLIGPMVLDIPYISHFAKGIYFDFNQAWYSDVGYQVI